MNRTPGEVLLARATFHFEKAQLQIVAGQYTDATDSIEQGLSILKEVQW